MGARLGHGDGLLRKHVEGVRRLAGHLVRDAHDADDVAQEALLAAVGRFPRSVRNVGAWLRGIVRHKALDLNRSEGRRRRHESRAMPRDATHAADEAVAHLEIQEHVVAAVRALPAPYRDVLWLRYFKDASTREIAAFLAVPVETVRTRLRRALARLRAALDETYGGRRTAWTAALSPMLPEGGLSPALALKGAAAIMTSKVVVTCTLAAVALLAVAVSLAPGLGREENQPSPNVEADPNVRAAVPSPDAPSSPRLRGDGAARSPVERRPREVGAAPIQSVEGSVSTGDGRPIAGARVYVVQGPGIEPDVSPPWRILGRTTGDESGRFAIRLETGRDVPPAPPPKAVLAIAEAEGYVRGRKPIELTGPKSAVDFRLREGLAFEAHVIDPSGRALPDLPVRVATFRSPPHMMYGSLFWSDRKRLASDDGTYLEARARTDEHGHFRVRGLDAGRYGVISEDLRWFVEQEDLVDVDRTRNVLPVTYRAFPARAVLGTVRDAATGERLAQGVVEFMLHARGGDSFASSVGVRAGRYLAGWHLDDDLRGHLEVKVTASAKGYKKTRSTGVLTPDAPILTLDLALEPIHLEMGRVILTATDPSGAPLPGLVWIFARHKSESGIRLRRRPARQRRGVFRFDLPAGTYDLFVEPHHVLGHLGSGHVEVTVLPKQEVQAAVVAGGGATVRLRLPLVSTMPPSSLKIEAVGEHEPGTMAGAATDLTLQEEQILAGEELVWTGFPPGTWRFELHWGRDHVIERTVRLVKGDDQTLAFR